MDTQNKWENTHGQNNLLTGQATEDKKKYRSEGIQEAAQKSLT